MRHLIEELMQGKIIGETVQRVEPVKIKAATALIDLHQRLESETEARVKAENISGYTFEDADYAYKEVMNKDYAKSFL